MKRCRLILGIAERITYKKDNRFCRRASLLILLRLAVSAGNTSVCVIIGGYSITVFLLFFAVSLFLFSPLLLGILTGAGETARGRDCGALCRLEEPSVYFSSVFSGMLFWLANLIINGLFFALVMMIDSATVANTSSITGSMRLIIVVIWAVTGLTVFIKTVYYFIIAGCRYKYAASAFGTLMKNDPVGIISILKLISVLFSRILSCAMIFTVPENLSVIVTSVYLHYEYEKQGELHSEKGNGLHYPENAVLS